MHKVREKVLEVVAKRIEGEISGRDVLALKLIRTFWRIKNLTSLQSI
jgi:hypothetical protein